MRPLGGALVGHIGDKFGRRAALTFSVTAMAVPTFLVGVLPGYDVLGMAAPILLTLLRMVQGLSVGGEYTTSIVFMVEQAPPGRRGLLGAMARCGAVVGIVSGSATGALIASPMSPDGNGGLGLADPIRGRTAGRLSQLLSCDGKSAEAAADQAWRSPAVETVQPSHGALLARLAGLSAFNAVGFYMMFLYIVSWLQFADGIAPAHALEINTVSMVLLIPVLLASGWLSIELAESRSCCLPCSWGLFGAFPLLRLMHHANPTMILAGQLGFTLMIGMFWGTLPAAMVEAAPREVRCSALSLGFNVTAGIVGGLTPLSPPGWSTGRRTTSARPT